MSSKQVKLLKKSKTLCWEGRLLHRNSKVRYAANIDLKLLCDSVVDPKDHRIREIGSLFKETVSDSDVVVQDKALDALIAYLKAADADVAGRYAKEVCDAVMEKCLVGRPKTVEKAQMVFMLWVELEAVDAFLDAMEKAIKSQDAKVVVLALDFMIQALSEFGCRIVPLNRIFKMLVEILDHQDQSVCASFKGLTLEIYHWVGINPIDPELYKKMSDTMKKELDIELPIVKLLVHPPRRIRSEQNLCGLLNIFPSEESAAETLVDPVDILTPLEKSGFWNKVKSRKWTQRKEAVAKLTELASTKRIASGDYTELCCILKKLITDRSISVRVEAVRAIGNLALELRVSFSRCSHILLPVLLAKLREKKPIMTEALTNTLEAIHKAGCVTLAGILTDVIAAVKSEDSHVCSRTLNWVMYCIDSSNKAVILNVHKDYVSICLECLNDGTAQVRDAAFSVLVAIAKSVGTELLNMPLEKLDDVRRKKLSEIIGVSGSGAPTVARHGIRRQGVSRRRIVEANMARGMKADGPGQKKLDEHKEVEPSEMTLKENESRLDSFFQEHSITRLKNAASKEPLEGINQLQKMSSSDPQEQNKKDIDGEDGYYQFQKSSPAWWHADDYFERLSPEELMAEVRPCQEWRIAHTCTRCGILDHRCRCKRRARLQNMEFPEPMYAPPKTIPPKPVVSYKDRKRVTPLPFSFDPWDGYEWN